LVEIKEAVSLSRNDEWSNIAERVVKCEIIWSFPRRAPSVVRIE
jgi:hypothetical protein